MTIEDDRSHQNTTPDSFWDIRARELDSEIEPVSSYLSKQIAGLRDFNSELATFGGLLPGKQIGDPVGLQNLARAFSAYKTQIEKKKASAIDFPKPKFLPVTYLASEKDLRQMIDQVQQRVCTTLDLLSSQVTDEANRWLALSTRIRAEDAQEKARLTQRAETLMSNVKSVSEQILAEAATEIKRIEQQFEVDRSRVKQDQEIAVPPQTGTVNFIIAGSGAVGILVGLFIFKTSALFGGILGLLGVVLLIVGVSKIRKTPVQTPVIKPTQIDDGTALRLKVREVSEAAEHSVSSQVLAIKSELRQVKATLDGIPTKEQSAHSLSRETANTLLANLRATEVERGSKMVSAIRDICVQWEQLAQQLQDRVIENWKQQVVSGAATLSSSLERLRVQDGEVSTKINLGTAQFPAPSKVRRLVGDVVIGAPLDIDFSESGICVQAPSLSSQHGTSAVCTKLALELTAAVQGRLRIRLWDPLRLGADYSELLTLTQFKATFVESGRALTTSRELDETLIALQKKTADRMALLAKGGLNSWINNIKPTSAPEDDFELLVVVGFPTGFSEQTIATLQSVATAGVRCGIFLLVELGSSAVADSMRERLRSDAVKLTSRLQTINFDGKGSISFSDHIVKIPTANEQLFARARSVLELVDGRADAVQKTQDEPNSQGDISFEAYRNLVAPDIGWKESSKDGLTVRLGTGFSDDVTQTLCFDNSTPHALLLGGTGSGKSNLLHSVIQGLALDYSPVELCFYLADLKDGVEFSNYTQSGRLPHAAAIAATADPRYAVALVRAAADELTRRNKLFIGAGCKNFEKYRSVEHCTLPRILLVIDEFQVLFEDRDSQREVISAFINLCKKGRSAGIHLLLATQSLKGKAGGIDEVLGQIQTRILMKITAADGRFAVSDPEMAIRAAAKCTRRGLGCVDFNFGGGEELYFRNPHVDNDSYFFDIVRHNMVADGSATYLDEEPVVWTDEARSLKANPQFKRLEKNSRKILVGEPYALEHAVGFPFSKSNVDCVALVSASSSQQLSILSSIAKSATSTCGSSVSAIFIRNADSVLGESAIQSIFEPNTGETRIVDGSQTSITLNQCRTDLLARSNSTESPLVLIFILGSSDLTIPKRNSLTSAPVDKGVLSDVEIINEMLSTDFQGQLHFVVACKSPVTFVDQLSPIKDRIGIRIFGQAPPGSRLKDFVGQADVGELNPQDMGLILSSEAGVKTFKPFGVTMEMTI